MKTILTSLLFIFALSSVIGQTDHPKLNKEERRFHHKQHQKVKMKFESNKDLESLPIIRNTLINDTSKIYFKTNTVLTLCPEKELCNPMFASGLMTGEMFYKSGEMDPNRNYSMILTNENGDTIKQNPLWNDGKGSMIILNFEHVRELDKNDKRYFVVSVTTQIGFIAGASFYYLELENDSATKKTDIQDFMLNSTKYRLFYSHAEM